MSVKKKPVPVKYRIVTPHRVVGFVSLIIGLSFTFENYQLVSRSLATPFALMEWVPGIPGQMAWGLCFIFGGSLILLSFNIYVRAVALTLGAFSWFALSAPSLYEAYLGPQRHETGGYAGWLALTICALCLVASRRLKDDFNVEPDPDLNPSPTAKVSQ